MSNIHATSQSRSPLIDAEEVAELLGVTKGWVYKQTREGMIPVVRLGRYCRYRRDAIESWLSDLERRGVEATPDSSEDSLSGGQWR